MIDSPSNAPVEPRRRKVAIEQTGDLLEVRYRNPQWVAGCFLVVWLIGWTVACVFLAGDVLHERRLFMLVFAIPFWASWFFVLFLLLSMFLQQERLVLDRQGIEFARRVVLPVHVRLVPLEEILTFDGYTTRVDSESDSIQQGIELRSVGHLLRFVQGISAEECRWLVHQLNRHLAQLQASVPAGAGHRIDREAPSTGDGKAVDWLGEAMVVAAQPIKPPSDSRWVRVDGFDELTFRHYGRLGCAAVGCLLFINLFWNGVVSVFVMSLLGLAPGEMQVRGIEWWGLFFFLIPFEVIGLTMFLLLLCALLEPVHRTSWVFTRQSIKRRSKWLGLGPTRTWWVKQLNRIILCSEESRPGTTVRGMLRFSVKALHSGEAGHRLMVIDQENREFCSINELTLGEARWIADSVLRERPLWFK